MRTVWAAAALIAVVLLTGCTSGAEVGPSPAKPSGGDGASLPWAPPEVTYTNKHINLAMTTVVNRDTREVALTPGVDYNLIFDEVLHQRVVFTGGRNLKIIGAEFDINTEGVRTGFSPNQGDYYGNSTGPEFRDQTGTVFIEGLWVHGAYALDGIRSASGSKTQFVLQNVRLESDRVITGLTDVADGFYHTDGFQAWGGVQSLQMYNVTISNPYQGGMIGGGDLGGSWGKTTWERVNLRPGLTAGQASKLFNIVGDPTQMKGPLSFKDVYYAIGDGTQWNSAYSLPTAPPYLAGGFYSGTTFGTDSTGRDYAVPQLSNYPGLLGLDDGAGGEARIYRGLPPEGDYVKAGGDHTGIHYLSPGYSS